MKSLQQLLWEQWGTKEHPAEWDGRDGAGGKGSQRFWEYLWALDAFAPLGVRVLPKRILDVGGGNLFFASLLSQKSNVDVVDPEGVTPGPGMNVVSWKSTLELFGSSSNFDWVTCISVLEHVDDKPKFCSALDQFQCPISLTFEFGEGGVDSKTMYSCLDQFKNHHVARMELCPIWADNSSINKWRPMGLLLVPSVRE